MRDLGSELHVSRAALLAVEGWFVAQSGMVNRVNTTPSLMEGGTVIWRGLFAPDELDQMEHDCDALQLEQAQLTGSTGIRATQVAWVHRAPATEPLYQRMEAVVLRLNTELFRFELSGLTPMQYAVYRQSEGGFFDWHTDYGRYRGDPGAQPRKITMSLQLSEAGDYGGCDLEIRAAHPVDTVPRARGTLAAFRANALHRVTPITRGIRKSLVIWAAGPEFR